MLNELRFGNFSNISLFFSRVLTEQLKNILVFTSDRLGHWCTSIGVFYTCIGTIGQEQFHDFPIATKGSDVKGCISTIIFGIYICSVSNK